MNANKLDGKAIGAGLLLLLNIVLWFVQTGLDYAIADGGFWGVGGIIQNYTVLLAEPSNWMFLLAMLIAAIMLFTRKRAAVIIGLLVLAGYLAYALIPNISGEVMDWLNFACRVAAIVFAVLAVALSSDDGVAHKIAGGLAIVLIVAWLILTVILGITGGTFASMDIIVAAVYILRCVALAVGVALAAKTLMEKKPAGAHWA